MLNLSSSTILIVVVIGALGVGGFAVYVWAKGGAATETGEQRQARVNSVFSLLQFLMGTVAVGVLTTTLSQSLKEREEVSKETEEIAKLLTYALTADGQARVHFADFFAHLSRDKEYRDQWINYRDDIKGEIANEAKIKAESAAIQKKLQDPHLSLVERSKLTQQLIEKNSDLDVVQATLAPVIPSSPLIWPFSVMVDANDLVVNQVFAEWFGGAQDAEDNGLTASGINLRDEPNFKGCALPMSGFKTSTLSGSPIPKLPWKTIIRVTS